MSYIKCFTILFQNHTMNVCHTDNQVKIHFVIHKEALCAKTTSLKNTMIITT